MARIHPSTVPASLVFSEDMYDAWITWSRTQNPPDSELPTFSRMPDHGEFLDFRNWLHPEELIECTVNHHRHPSTASDFDELCPLCVMKIYTEYLELIEGAWVGRNGGKGTLKERSDREYMQLKAAWYYAKKELMNATIAMEIYMQEELEWEAENPGINTSATWSAKRAIGTAGPALTAESRTLPLRKKKTLRFAPEVIFNEDTARPIPQYTRKSPIYRPGRHACPSVNGWRNTSHATSWRTTLRQMKVFLTSNEADFQTKTFDHRKSEGILAHHKLSSVVVQKIKMELNGADLEDKTKIRSLVCASDAILILNPRAIKKDRHRTYDIQDLTLLSLPDEEVEVEPRDVPIPDHGGPMDLD